MTFLDDFFPTPPALINKMFEGINFRQVESILEPSAGKGDIADRLLERWNSAHNNHSNKKESDIDVIEINPDLQHILKGKGHRLIFNDFLQFSTFKKYDLIVMNPPFSAGEKHLLKAIEIQKNGGCIVCVLNAETLRNPCTYARKDLLNLLSKYKAKITYLPDEFRQAERITGVEIAIVKLYIPEVKKRSLILDTLDKAETLKEFQPDQTAITVNEFIKATVAQFNYEILAGLNLIREYKKIEPLIHDSYGDYSSPCLKLSLKEGSYDHHLSENRFVELIRIKYWKNLFINPKFTTRFTGNLMEKCLDDVGKLKNYDFNEWNINRIRAELSEGLIKATEDTLEKLFDKLTHEHHWHPETNKNRHYFNGWATNKAWKINKKVILPMDLYAALGLNPKTWGQFYGVERELTDIDKTLRYLSGDMSSITNVREALERAKRDKQSKDIVCEYFTLTCYKKGTTHITFTDEELLKKFNIYGCQKKNWLPPGYGREKYTDLKSEEKEVIDSYEGETSYKETHMNAEYYLGETNPALFASSED